jgi:hypothetical protein
MLPWLLSASFARRIEGRCGGLAYDSVRRSIENTARRGAASRVRKPDTTIKKVGSNMPIVREPHFFVRAAMQRG